MPTPLGHAMAGLAIAWTTEAIRPASLDACGHRRLPMICAGLAIAPDLDLVYPPIHRTMSHSISAVLLVGVIAWFLTRRTKPEAALIVGVLCGLVYASHLGLDWLGGDTKLPAGIQLLWPFSHAWFISSRSLFRATVLGGFFRPSTMLSNALAIAQELLILGPVLLGSWFLRNRRCSEAPRSAQLR